MSKIIFDYNFSVSLVRILGTCFMAYEISEIIISVFLIREHVVFPARHLLSRSICNEIHDPTRPKLSKGSRFHWCLATQHSLESKLVILKENWNGLKIPSDYVSLSNDIIPVVMLSETWAFYLSLGVIYLHIAHQMIPKCVIFILFLRIWSWIRDLCHAL